MRSKVSRGVILLLAGTLVGCTLFSSSGRIIYQQGRTTVQLERDPSAGGTFASGGNAHPASIKPLQLATLLRGIQIRSEQGILGTILGLAAPADTVFTEEEVSQLAPILADGLTQAGPSERLGFTLWSAQPGRRNSPLAGHIAVRESYLRFGLNDHPTVGWQDPEDSSAPKLYELEFVNSGFLLPGSEEERKTGRKTRPLLQIDYRRYLSAVQDQPAAVAVKEPAGVTPSPSIPAEVRSPSVPSAAAPRESAKSDVEVVQELQRQVKELTDSNQELRAKLKGTLERQEQSQAMSEELARLRRDLAETKQLLADKVLELNRLKNKPGGTNKGKK